MGRPPMLNHLKRDKRLVVMLTDEEMAAVNEAARTARSPSLSEWIRETLLKACEGSVKAND